MNRWRLYFAICGTLLFFCTCSKSQRPSAIPKPRSTPLPKEVTSAEVVQRNDGLAWRRGDDQPFNGTTIDRHPTGKKAREIPFKDGRTNGVCRLWNSEGILVARRYYEAGELWAELAGENARQVEAKFQKRDELDATIWKNEALRNDMRRALWPFGMRCDLRRTSGQCLGGFRQAG